MERESRTNLNRIQKMWKKDTKERIKKFMRSCVSRNKRNEKDIWMQKTITRRSNYRTTNRMPIGVVSLNYNTIESKIKK